MDFHTSHPLQPFWSIAAAPLQAQALQQALEHGLFERLLQPATAASAAQQLGLNLTATRVWLDLLWSMELLHRQLPEPAAEPEYATSAMAARFFAGASPENCAQAWLYRARLLGGLAAQWGALLREGANPLSTDGAAAPKGSWAQAAREQIGQEQRAITVPAVQRLLDSLPPLQQHGRLLDLGGGPGHVAIALARRLPGWTGTVCDQPQTAEVARENIAAAGLSQRLEAVGCDLNHDSIGAGHDLIWSSSVLHFLRDPQAAVRKMLQALKPGGLLLLAHAELVDDAALAARVLPFYGALLLRGNFLPRQGDMARMMLEAGCADVRALGRVDFPMAPVWVYAGRRP